MLCTTLRGTARAAVPALVLLLAGCGSMKMPSILGPDETPLGALEARSERLAEIEDWTANGRIAVRTLEESWSARVSWTQRGEAYRLRLSGPLGQGAAQLVVRPGAVELRTADDTRYTAETPEELLRAHLGWSIPLDGLRYWLMGIPDPNVEPGLLDVDENGRLTRLDQSGFTISYHAWREHGDIPMPTRLDFESPRLTGKVAVSSWELPLDTAAR